jgi:hypothetical protein
MGVKNQTIEQMVKNEFFKVIVFTFLSHILFYAGLALFSGFIFRIFFQLYEKFLKRKILIIYGVLSISHLALMHYAIIRFPQFIDEAIQNVSFLKPYVYFLTDNFSPYFFLSIVCLILGLFVFSFVRVYKWMFIVIVILTLSFMIMTSHDVTIATDNLSKPNILLLSADSYRLKEAKKLNLFNQVKEYGELYEFTNMKTVLPRTFPSWTSILTGVYPVRHHIFNMFPEKKQRSLLHLTPMPAYLKNRGYKTAVFSDFAGDIFSRIDYGFDVINAPYFNFSSIIKQRILEAQINLMPYIMNGFGQKLYPYLRGIAKLPRADILTGGVIKEINNSERPFFITVFYSDPHFPYAVPYPYYRGDKSYNGVYKYMKNQTLTKTELSKYDKKHIKKLFTGAEKHVKYNVDEIIDVLIETGKIHNTIIAFFSDHGENVFDYADEIGHGDHLYDRTTTIIPFYLFLPGKYAQDKQVDLAENAGSIDIYPTILHAAGFPAVDNIDGRNLFNSDPDRVIFMETGLWFVNDNGAFYQNERIIYPDLTQLLEIEWGNNFEPALKEDYLPLTEKAKHRAICYQDYTLLYIPTKDRVFWKLLRDGRRIPIAENEAITNKLKRKFINHYEPYFDEYNEFLHLKN